jgi:D-threo-aldose 1-dehydrogenase
MKTSPLGRTNLSVTTLGFGAAPIGNLFTEVTDDEARDAVESAWSGGIRYFDTAPHYGLGLSERRVGAALKEHPRSEYVLSTKVGRLLRPNPHPQGSDLASGGFATPDDLVREIDYSQKGVIQSLEESLERLGTSYVDVVYVHDPDRNVDQVGNETFPTLVKLRDEGVVGAIGAGMNDWRPLLTFVERCDIDVVMVAGRWTLLDRSAAPLLKACAQRGVSVVSAAPFNSGILASNTPQVSDNFDYGPVPSLRLAQATALAELCSRHGVDLPQLALQFPLRHEAVAAVVAGMRSEREVRLGAEMMDRPVPSALWDELERFDAQWLDQ